MVSLLVSKQGNHLLSESATFHLTRRLVNYDQELVNYGLQAKSGPLPAL
jgi:hypothetical protein